MRFSHPGYPKGNLDGNRVYVKLLYTSSRIRGPEKGGACQMGRNALGHEEHSADSGPQEEPALSTGSGECCSVWERIPELLEPIDPADPEEEVLAPMRQHLETCTSCQRALEELRCFRERGRRALARRPSPAEQDDLEARAAVIQQRVMRSVRSQRERP